MEKTGLKSEYILADLDELMEYMWLKPADSTLAYDIFVDDGEAYIRGASTSSICKEWKRREVY